MSSSFTGHLLIASPRMDDPNFARTVLLLVQHDDEGAFGLVLNRPSDSTVRGLWEQVGEGPCHRDDVVHIGGPCSGPLMALHTCHQVSQKQVLPGLFFTSEADDLRYLVNRRRATAKYFVGYAGWAPGQLEVELAQSAWYVLPATARAPFDRKARQWTRLLNQIMGVPDLWPRLIPPDPSVN